MIGVGQKVIWAGGEHEFCLTIGHLRTLEQRLNAGTGVILTRLWAGQFYLDDVIEVVRLGLMGGGLSEARANLLLERTYPKANIVQLSVTAARVLALYVSWPTGEEADDPLQGEASATTTSPNSPPSPTDSPGGRDTSPPLQ